MPASCEYSVTSTDSPGPSPVEAVTETLYLTNGPTVHVNMLGLVVRVYCSGLVYDVRYRSALLSFNHGNLMQLSV